MGKPFVAVSVLLLAGCVSIPIGPSVRVLPAPGKPFDVFVREDALCRQFAVQQTAFRLPSRRRITRRPVPFWERPWVRRPVPWSTVVTVRA